MKANDNYNIETNETPDDMGGYVSMEVIESYREANRELIDTKIALLLRGNPHLTETAIRASIKTVDLYLRLSQLKREISKKESNNGSYRVIPGRRDKVKATAKKHKNTEESMSSQFYSCVKRIEQEIKGGNLWMLGEVWQEVYDGPEYRLRPVLSQMIKKRVHTKKAHYILSRHRDRLGRGNGLIVLIEEFRVYGVEFKAALQRDLGNTIVDDMELSFEAILSKQENIKISERINERLDYRRRNYKLNGSSQMLYGYEYDDEEGRRYVIPDETQKIQWAYDAREGGMSLHKIAVAMNEKGWRTREGYLWGSEGLARMLRRPEYMGVTVQYRNAYIYEHTGERKVRHINPAREVIQYPDGITPAIVSKEQWHRVNTLMDEANSFSRRKLANPQKHPLHGFFRCAYCGNRLHLPSYSPNPRKTKNGKEYTRYPEYVCRSKRRESKSCPGVTIAAHVVEKAALSFIAEEIGRGLPQLQKAVSQAIEKQQPAINDHSISRSIDGLSQQIAELVRNKTLVPDEFTKGVIQQRIDSLLAECESLEQDRVTQPDRMMAEQKKEALEVLRDFAERAREDWERAKNNWGKEEVDQIRADLILLDFCGYIAKEGDTEHERWTFTIGPKKILHSALSSNDPNCRCCC